MAPRPVLYLASGSPRRAALINLLGIKRIEIRPSSVEEVFDYSESPEAIVQDLAFQKAENSMQLRKKNDAPGVVLGADTIVVLDGDILGKPRDGADAAAMLRRLSGRTHDVYTAIAVAHGAFTQSAVERVAVTFRALTEDEIVQYIDTGEPMDKAGAYGIQGYGATIVGGWTATTSA